MCVLCDSPSAAVLVCLAALIEGVRGVDSKNLHFLYWKEYSRSQGISLATSVDSSLENLHLGCRLQLPLWVHFNPINPMTSTHSILPQSSLLDPPLKALPQGCIRLACPSLCSLEHALYLHIIMINRHNKHTHTFSLTYVSTHTYTHACTHTHAHTHTHTHAHNVVFYTCNAMLILFRAQWSFIALLRAARFGHAEFIQMLHNEFGCPLAEEDNVCVHRPMSTAVEATEVSGLHWRMYCGMNNMWHKGVDWLYIKFCQSYVHRKAGQQSLCQQQVVTLTWCGSWWSSLEQTCITRERRAVHLRSEIQSVIHICHVYLYFL